MNTKKYEIIVHCNQIYAKEVKMYHGYNQILTFIKFATFILTS